MKLALLDKDGTLVAPGGGKRFPEAPEDQILLDGVSDKITKLKSLGFTLVVVSNQGGVGMGYKSFDFALAEFRYLMGLLPQIDACYFCPTMDGSYLHIVYGQDSIFELSRGKDVGPIPGIGFRKPGAGMLEFALWDYKADLRQSIMIGDRFEDAGAAEAIGVRFIHVTEWE